MTAGNALRGESPMVHGGSTKIIVFDVNSLCLAEQALGISAFEILGLLNDDSMTMTQARALLWAGLSQHHPCSIAEAGTIISDVGLSAAALAILTALAAAFGIKAEDKEAADPSQAQEGWDWLKLLGQWTEAGLDPDRFWRQTPKLIRAALDGYAERCAWESKLMLTGAWWAAMLPRLKEPPSLPELLGEPSREQTGDEMADAFGAWENATA